MKKPVRVLQVVPNMDAGGIETFIMNIYRNIDRSKVQFDFLVHYKKPGFYDKEIQKLGGRIYRLSVREDNNVLKYLKDLDTFFKKHSEYNVVHGHMVSTAVFYMYYAKKYGVKLRIVHSHNTSTTSGLKGITKAQLAKLSTIFANKYFACGVAAGNYLYGNRKFTVINNGIDLNKFKFNANVRNSYRKKWGLNNKLVIGHIGRFNLQKNHVFLIKIFYKIHKMNPNSVLLLAGKGELESSIKKEVKKYNLENSVKFLGVRDDTPVLYQVMDVFLLPSLFEGVPVVAMEAQAAGVPVLASSSITKEIKLTPIVKFLNLKDSSIKWAEEAINLSRLKRMDYTEELARKGYDVKKEAVLIGNYYCKFYGKK